MTLADILIDQMVFFATAPDDAVDPDAAVQQLESIRADLARLPPSELAVVRGAVESRIDSARTPDELRAVHELRDDLLDL
jgi:hypothetical protein